MKTLLLVVSVLILMSFTVSVEEQVTNDLKQMSNYFAKNNNIKLRVDYSVYEGYDNKKAESQITGYFSKYDSLSIMSLNGNVTYSSPDYQISINKNNTTIVLNNGVTSKDLLPDFDKTKEYLDTAKQLGFVQSSDAKMKGIFIEFYPGSNAYDKIEMHYNTDNYLIGKIIFYQKNGSSMGSDWDGKEVRAEVKYTKMKAEVLNRSVFKLDNYIEISKDELRGVGKYTNYKVIDIRTEY